MRRVCVFCGSSVGVRPEYGEAASALGAILADREIGLVYGGGRLGLMGFVADAALACGSEFSTTLSTTSNLVKSLTPKPTSVVPKGWSTRFAEWATKWQSRQQPLNLPQRDFQGSGAFILFQR